MRTTPVPYFAQWETPSLIQDILAGEATTADDRQWKSSGALNNAEYIQWANHICGMACLKMILANQNGLVLPTLELTRKARRYGAYTVDGTEIRGMIYAPFVTFVEKEFSMHCSVTTGISAQEIPLLMSTHEFFIASVHPWIRWPERTPPKKGGHLVLVISASEHSITFHNPSGHTRETQANAVLSIDAFDAFFAGRGIAIAPTT